VSEEMATNQLAELSHILSQPLLVIVVHEFQFVIPDRRTDQHKQFGIGLLAEIDAISGNSGTPVAIGDIQQFLRRNVIEIGNDHRRKLLPELRVSDVSTILREDNFPLVAKVKDIDWERIHSLMEL